MAKPPENRRHERFRATLTVQVVSAATQTFGTLYEISLGGGFIQVSPLPPVGSLITVCIQLIDERANLPAEVRYRMATEVGPRGLEGVGVSWTELTTEEQALVGRLVERARSGKSLRG